MSTQGPLAALQRALAAEHAALFVYGALGARTSAAATPELFAQVSAAYDVHRARRDQLTARIRDRGAEPLAAEAAYDVPQPQDTGQVAAEALGLEQGCAATYAWVCGQVSGADRRWALEALTDAAVRGLTFRGSPEIFPGGGERTDR